MIRRTAALCSALVALTAIACADASSSGVTGGPTGDTSVARGAEIYAASCASCHGDDLRGTPVGPSLLSELYGPDRHTDEAFEASIRNGAPQRDWTFGPMPSVGAVRGSDLEAVLAFVRTEQDREGLEAYPPE